MGKSNFYQRSFGEEPPAPTEIVSPEALERMKVDDLKYVGPTGEYDEMGLAKRVALYLDLNDEIDERDTVTISQEGSAIIVVNSSSLDDAECVRTQIENERKQNTNINARLLIGVVDTVKSDDCPGGPDCPEKADSTSNLTRD